jgi:hypothetical protein
MSPFPRSIESISFVRWQDERVTAKEKDIKELKTQKAQVDQANQGVGIIPNVNRRLSQEGRRFFHGERRPSSHDCMELHTQGRPVTMVTRTNWNLSRE